MNKTIHYTLCRIPVQLPNIDDRLSVCRRNVTHRWLRNNVKADVPHELPADHFYPVAVWRHHAQMIHHVAAARVERQEELHRTLVYDAEVESGPHIQLQPREDHRDVVHRRATAPAPAGPRQRSANLCEEATSRRPIAIVLDRGAEADWDA